MVPLTPSMNQAPKRPSSFILGMLAGAITVATVHVVVKWSGFL
jgi:hypothetical protein